MATITILVDGVTHEVRKRSFVIGSDAGCDVVIEGDPEVAAQHVRVILRRWDAAMIVHALAAPTFVNGGGIDAPVTVTGMDRVRIGAHTTLMFASTGVVIGGGRRWWDPRDWGTGDVARAPQPVSSNPPAPEPEPVTVPPPPDPVPTWNPPPPQPLLINPPPPTRNPPAPRFEALAALPAPRWRARLSDDATEQDLLAALRDAPADPGARMVYADWLERAGREVCAGAVRGDDEVAPIPRIVPITDDAWRGIASCAGIHACDGKACPARWSALGCVQGDERSRACATCDQRVYYATSVGELEVLGGHAARYAIDAGMADIDHAALYNLGRSRR